VLVSLVVAKFVLWITPTPLVWNRPACAFSSLSALENNKRIYGVDISNAFAEAPPPAQTFYMRVDRVLQHWWTTHLGLPTISYRHPEFPRLRERHVTATLEVLGFVPTTDEPCIYQGKVDDSSVIFLCQVDDFAIALNDPATYENICGLFDAGWASSACTMELTSSRPAFTYDSTLRVKVYKILAASTWIGDTPRARIDRPVPMNASTDTLRSL
jgi:hypothetical protein